MDHKREYYVYAYLREAADGFISEKVRVLGHANRGRRHSVHTVESSRPKWREAQKARRERERLEVLANA